MTKQLLLLLTAIFLSIVYFSCSAPSNEDVQKPNIIFIMADDHTSQAWGIYGGILKD